MGLKLTPKPHQLYLLKRKQNQGGHRPTQCTLQQCPPRAGKGCAPAVAAVTALTSRARVCLPCYKSYMIHSLSQTPQGTGLSGYSRPSHHLRRSFLLRRGHSSQDTRQGPQGCMPAGLSHRPRPGHQAVTFYLSPTLQPWVLAVPGKQLSLSWSQESCGGRALAADALGLALGWPAKLWTGH